ncbi:MAG: Fur family transcriptional regulator [Chloroflexota bacterium]
MTEEQITAALRQAGHRITQPRRAVVRALLDDQGHSSPSQIRARARQHCPSVGYVTVYRTLELLSGMGFVRRVHSEGGCHGRASVALGHRHHLVCRQCGAVVEFEGCDLSPLLNRVGDESGYLIQTHLLELVGLCPKCR